MQRYEIIEEIAKLNRRRDSCLSLDQVKYNENTEPFYRIQVWYFRPYGEDPGRGITLRASDLRALYEALHDYFTRDKAFSGTPKKVETPEDLVHANVEAPELVNDTPL